MTRIDETIANVNNYGDLDARGPLAELADATDSKSNAAESPNLFTTHSLVASSSTPAKRGPSISDYVPLRPRGDDPVTVECSNCTAGYTIPRRTPGVGAVSDTSRRPRALDLFCGAGGATRGLQLAGFHVTGVDIEPQPRYVGDAFQQADAMTIPLDGFDFIWASPPCQAHTSMKTMHNAKRHADLIPETRARLIGNGAPYVIENVPGAPLRNAILLCGTMFGLGCEDAELRRHRLFEASIQLLAPECRHGNLGVIGVYGGHLRNRKRVRTIGVYGEGCRDSRRKSNKAHPDFSVEHGRAAMGIDWMTLAELCQAIPPAYSKFIGEQMMPHVLARMSERGAA